MLNRKLKNTRYEKVSLKGLATNICKAYNLTLTMSEEGPQIEHVSQSAMSDMRFLNEICDRLGYSVQDVGKALVIKKRAYFTNEAPGFVVQVGKDLLSFNLTDRAQTNSVSSEETIKIEQGQQSVVVDGTSGALSKVAEPNKNAAGDKTKSTPGLNVPATQLKTDSTSNDAVYQRPSGKPVKEFQAQIALLTSQSALVNIVPDKPFLIEGSLDFAKKPWFVESVSHTYKNGLLTTDVSAYLPVAAKKSKSGGSTNSSSSSSTNSAGVGKVGAYKIVNALDKSNVAQFSDLSAHWIGSSKYTTYKERSGQKGGRVSYIGKSEYVVYDIILLQNNSSNVIVPSPCTGIISAVNAGFILINCEDGSKVKVVHCKHQKVKPLDKVVFGTPLGEQSDVGRASVIHVHIECKESILSNYIKALTSGNFSANN